MIEFRTLGTINLQRVDGGALQSVLAQPKRLALLAYLAVATPRGPHRRDALTGIFWPELDQTHARAALRKSLHYLRRSLGPDVIKVGGNEDVLLDVQELWCDAAAFDEAVKAEELHEAMKLYQGELLPGFHISGAPGFERWLDGERSRLTKTASATAWGISETEWELGNAIESAHWAQRAAAITPLEEPALQMLVSRLVSMGDSTGALRACDEFTERLAKRGLDPSPKTRAIARSIRQATPVEGLEPLQQKESGPARTPTTPVDKSGRRKAWLVGAAMAAVAMAAAVVVGTLVPRQTAMVRVPNLDGSSSAFAPEPPAPRSIAVLPFVNIGDNPETEFFSDGITDDLILQLSKIGDLKVISRASSAQYRDREKGLKEMAAELGVALVLDGSVRLSEGRVRIIAELIEAGTDVHVWAEEYDRDLSDIFVIQSEVALEIAQALDAELTSAEESRIKQIPTESLAAYRLYLKGRQIWNQRTGLDEAVEYYELALEQDPVFPLAFAGLADVYVVLPPWGWTSPAEAYPKAMRYAERALSLDSTLASAHAALGLAKLQFHLDWEGAESEYRRALELDPDYPSAHYYYAMFLSQLGRFQEAIREGEAALETDPLSLGLRSGLSDALYSARRYKEAEALLATVVDVYPHFTGAHAWLGLVALAQGRLEEGVAELERVVELDPDLLFARLMVAYAYAVAGERDASLRLIDSVSATPGTQWPSPVWIGAAYGELGDLDAAFEQLERGYRERDTWITRLNVWPIFDPLRSDPRFSALTKRIGLD
jgi:TolB-like protein/DNA-binding SARP family transcriptional activator/Tfp pilus assembly protein PilF